MLWNRSLRTRHGTPPVIRLGRAWPDQGTGENGQYECAAQCMIFAERLIAAFLSYVPMVLGFGLQLGKGVRVAWAAGKRQHYQEGPTSERRTVAGKTDAQAETTVNQADTSLACLQNQLCG